MKKTFSKRGAAQSASFRRQLPESENTMWARIPTDVSFSSGPPTEIMWMPAGKRTITPTLGDKPGEVTLECNRETAQVMQACLENYLNKGLKPYLDFNHAEDRASGWVVAFAWRDGAEPGVYAQVDWSQEGADAITGKVYRSFSPAAMMSKKGSPKKVLGAPLCMGGLVNDPAFREIKPLWARGASSGELPDDAEAKNQHTDMKNREKLLAALAAIEGLTTDLETLRAAHGKDGVDNTATIKAKSTELKAAHKEATRFAEAIQAGGETEDEDGDTTLQARLDKLEEAEEARTTEMKAARKETAQAAIEEAVLRGAIPPQAVDLKAHWQRLCESDPANLVLLANLPGKDVIKARVVKGAGVDVTREDPRQMLVTFGRCKDAKERGIMFARNIQPVFKDDDDGLLEMSIKVAAANSMGTLTGTLVVQRSLQLLKWEFPALNRISTDFSAENAKLGQTIMTRLLTVPAVSDYDVNTGYAINNAATVDVPVVINKHKSVAVRFTVNDLASTRRLLFMEQEEPMHYAVGLQMITDLYANITTGNFNDGGAPAIVFSTIEPLETFRRTTLINAGISMTNRKVRKSGRTLLANAYYHGQLGADPSVTQLAVFQAREFIETTNLPDIAGFKPIEAPNLPTANNLGAFGFTPDALAMAARVPSDYTDVFPGATGGGVVSIVTNPDSGLSVQLVQYINHDTGAATMRLAWMYGTAIGQAASGQLILSQ